MIDLTLVLHYTLDFANKHTVLNLITANEKMFLKPNVVFHLKQKDFLILIKLNKHFEGNVADVYKTHKETTLCMIDFAFN